MSYKLKPRILVVDDNSNNLYSMQKILSDLYADVDSVASGEEALKQILRHEYAMIFLDVQMPNMNGYEVAQCILQNERTANCPIVFVTAFLKDKDNILRGYDAGAIDYITKPVDSNILLAKTKILLELYLKTKELESVAESLEQSANYDTLTGLTNRNQFNYLFANMLAVKQRNNTPFALLLIDLDNFKRVNDTLGHDVGDLLLIEAAKLLKNQIRASDTVSRLGGDEFSILLSELTTITDAGKVAENILRAFQEPIAAGAHSVDISTSIGIASYPFAGETPTEMFKSADIALYRAKERGKNTFEFFNQSLNEAHTRWSLIDSALRDAVTNEEIYLAYQPRFDMRNDQIIGVEVLSRWQHHKLGNIPPAEFIKIAEDTGFIHELGDHILTQALINYEAWTSDMVDHSLVFAVNLSPYQLANPEFIPHLQQMMTLYHVPHHLIEIEVTESVFDGSNIHLEQQLKEISELGINISIDDFGTGYSSLSRLKTMPINILKIDQTFVRDLETNSDSQKIVQAIIALAQAMKLQIIAEGVETQAQKDILLSFGCHIAQGYFYSKPLSEKAFLDLLFKD